MPYVLLVVAIASEVTATVALQASHGLTRLVPSVIVVTGYLLSLFALAQTLKRGMPLAIAYGVWSAVGTAAIACIGVAFFGNRLSWVQIMGIVLVIGGVLALELGRAQ